MIFGWKNPFSDISFLSAGVAASGNSFSEPDFKYFVYPSNGIYLIVEILAIENNGTSCVVEILAIQNNGTSCVVEILASHLTEYILLLRYYQIIILVTV